MEVVKPEEKPMVLRREEEFEITEREAPLAPKEQLGHYKVGRWTWFEKQTANDSAIEIVDLKKDITFWHPAIYYTHMMLRCIKEHPENFKLTLEYLETQLDPDVGTIVKDACVRVNGLSREAMEGFLRPSSTGKDTPGSPSSGPAKT